MPADAQHRDHQHSVVPEATTRVRRACGRLPLPRIQLSAMAGPSAVCLVVSRPHGYIAQSFAQPRATHRRRAHLAAGRVSAGDAGERPGFPRSAARPSWASSRRRQPWHRSLRLGCRHRPGLDRCERWDATCILVGHCRGGTSGRAAGSASAAAHHLPARSPRCGAHPMRCPCVARACRAAAPSRAKCAPRTGRCTPRRTRCSAGASWPSPRATS